MKTGIVMEIQNGIAVILQPGGIFIERKTNPSWEVGDVVAVETPRKPKILLFKKLAAVAACLVLLVAMGTGSYALLFATTSIISVDINPSVELALNRVGRVVNVTAYNDDGSVLLAGLDLKGKPYAEAIPALLQSDAMQPYLATNKVLELSVYSKNNEQDLVTYLNTQGQAAAAEYPQLQVHCSGVGQAVVEQAHNYGISPGKMKALLELQKLDPSIDIEEYSHHSMAEIRGLIRQHNGEEPHQGQGEGNKNKNGSGSGRSGENSQQGKGNGGGQGNGNAQQKKGSESEESNGPHGNGERGQGGGRGKGRNQGN